MDWRICALLSAVFAALTAIFAKIGVRDINSNLATAIRVAVILFITWGIVLFTGVTNQIRQVTAHNWLFLLLSGRGDRAFLAVLFPCASTRKRLQSRADRQTQCRDYNFPFDPDSPRTRRSKSHSRRTSHHGRLICTADVKSGKEKPFSFSLFIRN